MNILVVGCGSIGSRHARNAARWANTAVVDIREDTAQRCAEALSIKAFRNMDKALEWKPHGVIIATSTNMHLYLAERAIRAGADVLIEKPISHTLNGVQDFLNHAEALGRKVYVGCNMRFHPGVVALQRNLGRIGPPLFARAHVGHYLPQMRPDADYRDLYCARRSEGGGVILDAIHEIDYLVWLLGRVREVHAKAGKLSGLDMDVEDFAALCLGHEAGCISEIHLDYLRPFKRRGCEIVGQEGMLLWQSEGKNPEVCDVGIYRKGQEQWETLAHEDRLNANAPYEEMLRYFLDGLEGEEVPLLQGREAADALCIALRAREISGT